MKHRVANTMHCDVDIMYFADDALFGWHDLKCMHCVVDIMSFADYNPLYILGNPEETTYVV